MSIDVAQRLRDALAKLDELLPQAESEATDRSNYYALNVVMREAREHTKLYADLLERIFNVEQVAAFQRSVLRVLERQSPELRREVEQELAREQAMVRANLLGTGR